jgi:hypothetical protein
MASEMPTGYQGVVTPVLGKGMLDFLEILELASA